jgi:hypothetical protein
MKQVRCLAAMGQALILLFLVGCATPEPEVIARPTVIVVTSQGPYYEDFTAAEGWLTGQTATSVGIVENDEYVMRVLQPNQLVWTYQPRAFGDAVYEADVTFQGGSEASGFGFLFLANAELSQFFYAMITGDGRYDVGFCERSCEQQESLIGGYTLASIILTGYQTNRLRLELDDSELTFIVNGASISQFRGVEISSGLFGFIAETSPYGALEVSFDNLSIIEETASTPLP